MSQRAFSPSSILFFDVVCQEYPGKFYGNVLLHPAGVACCVEQLERLWKVWALRFVMPLLFVVPTADAVPASLHANTHKRFHFKSSELFSWPPCCQTLCLLTFIKTQLNWISALQTHPCTHASLHPQAATYGSTIRRHRQTEHYAQMHTTACSTCTRIWAARFSRCSGTMSAARRSLSEPEGHQGAACG